MITYKLLEILNVKFGMEIDHELKYKICKKYYTWLSMVQNVEVTSRKVDIEQYLYLINNLLKKKITTKQTNNMLFIY